MVVLSLTREQIYIILDALAVMERQKAHTQNTLRVIRDIGKKLNAKKPEWMR